MDLKPKVVLQGMAGALMCLALTAGAQTPSTPAPETAPAQAPASAPAPAPAPAAPTWSVGPIDFSGLLDGYYSYNYNRPGSDSTFGQINQLYNFNDETDQFNLAEGRLTMNHDPDPVGVHADIIFGRANDLIHSGSTQTNDYIEQAFISYKPAKVHGAELDFGQFVTSAGAEVIEAKDNFNYSRSLLFVWAIPYYHFGLRTSIPATKTWTVGFQVVNGWNNVTANNGGVTIGLTSAYAKPKYTWSLNYYTGPENSNTQKGYRNLIDTELLLTPSSKFSAYINYDYGQQRIPAGYGLSSGFNPELPSSSPHWQGVAFAARGQISAKSALAGRFEYYDDNQGFETGIRQNVDEFTGTYEYKWLEGLLTRVEYRRDWSDHKFFDKGDTGLVKDQSTLTMAFIAFFGPKR